MTKNEDKQQNWPGKLPATPEIGRTLREHAKDMRRNPTRAEQRLWGALRARQRRGLKFRRQHIVEHYIVDFYCVRAGLVIEVDGEAHRYAGEYDTARTEFLRELGLHVLRFSNEDVTYRLAQVVLSIDATIDEIMSTE